MEDADSYCRYDCPPNKRCAAADPNFGCLVGTTRPHLPGQQRCCEVADHDYFLDTVRAISAYGNRHVVVQQNAGTAGVRQALENLLHSLDSGGAPDNPIYNGVLEIVPGQLDPSMIDNLVRVMQAMVPDSGFSVEMAVADIARQPLVWRENRSNFFRSMSTPLQNLPTNALTLASHLEIWARNVSGFNVVSLVLSALANPHPHHTASVQLRLDQGCDPPINRRNIAQIRASMRATRFIGTLTINSLPNPFAADVQLGQFQVAPGKTMNLTAHLCDLTLE